MTNWGVLWRTYLIVHPLLAIWVGLSSLPNWPASNEAWNHAGLVQQYYLGYFFYVSLVPICLVHLRLSQSYTQRPYWFKRALRAGLLLGGAIPALVLVLTVVALVLAESGAARFNFFVSVGHTPRYWVGIVSFLTLGQLIVLPHWVFFRRRPHQLALRQAALASS
jgi:hypothetical protein